MRRNAEAVLLLATCTFSVMFLLVLTWARLALHTAERATASVLENKDGVVMGMAGILIAFGTVLQLLL
jgi:hypothetical protein